VRFSPDEWFHSRGWEPFPFQREVWAAYLAGESGLIHAATGTGKTFAAWFGPLLEWQEEGAPAWPSLRVVWITPMRALAADTEAGLRAPVEDLGLRWTVGARTGDTSPATRARQTRRLPGALVTTPESLTLMIARAGAEKTFADVRLVVVDEWHELMGSKRGVQTELALARLRHWQPGLRTWGLSATLGNLDVAMHALLGRPGLLVRGALPKRVRIDALLPDEMETFPWAGHLGVRLLPQVVAAIEEARSTLVFTNTRSQAEIWYQAILDARPDWAGQIALHHGSLERKLREWVEDNVAAGNLKCVVCTSSLDLGVDFTPVDRVLQIGSPKGVARLLQRAGRSGHQPGVESRVTCVPTNALELVETAAARSAAEAGRIEDRYAVEKPLDLLAQHAVTIAAGGGFRADELFEEVRTTWSYRNLARQEWNWVLDFITTGGPALRAYPEYSRVAERNGMFVMADPKLARRHLLSVGTIVSDAAIDVRYARGARLGSVEESFVARLHPGDRFVFAGKTLELVGVRDMTAWVRKARQAGGAIPRWEGSRMPLSSELAEAVREKLDEARRGIFDSPEMQAVRPVLETQAGGSRIPGAGELLIERVRTSEGHHLFFYPFEGRLVHEGLAALFAYRMARLEPITFSMAVNDYGLELVSAAEPPLERALAAGLLSPANLVDDIPASLNAAEMARRHFREIARVAGLVFPGYPGQRRAARQFQASSSLLYDVFARYDPQNLLLGQAHREVLERQLERSRLGQALERVSAGQVTVLDIDRPSPLGFPLLVDRSRARLSSEKFEERVRRMLAEFERHGHRSRRRAG
jgi:ATP-dependent Lhr-like helicase